MTTPTVEEIVEEFQEGLVSSSPKIVSGSIGFYYGHKNGVELYDIDEMLNWLQTTLTKVAEEARREERECIVGWAKEYVRTEDEVRRYIVSDLIAFLQSEK